MKNNSNHEYFAPKVMILPIMCEGLLCVSTHTVTFDKFNFHDELGLEDF